MHVQQVEEPTYPADKAVHLLHIHGCCVRTAGMCTAEILLYFTIALEHEHKHAARQHLSGMTALGSSLKVLMKLKM